MLRAVLITLFLACLGSPALADVTVTNPWVRATTSLQKSTVAFMQISSSNEARLIKVDSPVAKVVEIHEMVMKNYMMKMQAIPAIDLPAGKVVELKPDGYMVMLTGLKQQIMEGDTVPMSIVIEGRDKKRETIMLNFSAMTLDSATADKNNHAHME